MTSRIVGLIIWGLIIAAPSAASAQSSAPNGKPSIGLFGVFDYSTIAAKQSFDAVFGKHTTAAPGVGIEVTNLWRGVFVRIAGTHTKLTGERVVVFNGEVFKLGIPLTAELTPLEFGAGWRLHTRNASPRFVPYAGASAITLKYKETSSFADASDNADESYSGFGVFGGVDVRLAGRVFGGLEAQYRSIKFTPAANSAADSFDETNLGGAVLRVRVGIRF